MPVSDNWSSDDGSSNDRPSAAPPDRSRGADTALRREGDRALDALICRLLALPMEQRTHFLRRRLPGGGSAL